MLRQAWTGGRPVSSICTDRTDIVLAKSKEHTHVNKSYRPTLTRCLLGENIYVINNQYYVFRNMYDSLEPKPENILEDMVRFKLCFFVLLRAKLYFEKIFAICSSVVIKSLPYKLSSSSI